MNDGSEHDVESYLAQAAFSDRLAPGQSAVGTAGALRARRTSGERSSAPPAALDRRSAGLASAGSSTAWSRSPTRSGAASRQRSSSSGRRAGSLDAHDELARGPVELITDPSLSVRNPDNPTHTAGTTFMGQFMDHDMTFDLASPLGRPTAPSRSPNGRTPTFDLDSVYGAGPVASPQLYDPTDRAKLKVEFGGLFEDVPRMPDGSAVIGDPRNDEHVVIAGLQAAFLCFHNRVVDRLRAAGTSDSARAYAAGQTADDLALPVACPARVPAAVRRAATGR